MMCFAGRYEVWMNDSSEHHRNLFETWDACLACEKAKRKFELSENEDEKKWAMEKFMQFLSCWTLKQANENWYTRCNLQHEFIIQISIFSFQKMHNKFYWTWLYNEEKSCKFIGMIIISLFIDFFHVIFFRFHFY